MVEKVVERIMEQCPDMIVFTGDLVSTTHAN
jgi:3',5'-cyclic AMP phosphodiesterase CpdA